MIFLDFCLIWTRGRPARHREGTTANRKGRHGNLWPWTRFEIFGHHGNCRSAVGQIRSLIISALKNEPVFVWGWGQQVHGPFVSLKLKAEKRKKEKSGHLPI